jgi:hypothetical protein
MLIKNNAILNPVKKYFRSSDTIDEEHLINVNNFVNSFYKLTNSPY